MLGVFWWGVRPLAKLENANLQKYPNEWEINIKRKMKNQIQKNPKNFPGKKTWKKSHTNFLKMTV
jgi:hypothetical protein